MIVFSRTVPSIQNGLLRFGEGLVHRGTSRDKSQKGDIVVDFKTIFGILKKYLADGYDVPEFFRDLMAMMTDVSEKDWGTEKDPNTKLTKESTLRSYAKRGLTKKFAESVVYRLTPQFLIENINSKDDAVRIALANDISGFDPTADKDNVATIVTGILVEVIQCAAGLVPQDALTKQKQKQFAAELKRKYGDYLLSEARNYCTFPGCGCELIPAADGNTVPTYEISLIDKQAPVELVNMIAMCPRCYATYQLDCGTKKLIKQLQTVKSALVTHHQSIKLIDDIKLDKGISGVIVRIKKLNMKNLERATMDPKEIKKKVVPEDDVSLYIMVNNYVNTYFIRIREIMISLDKRGEIDYDDIQDQMRAIYKKLKKTTKSKLFIFNEITEKVHRATLQDPTYCQIVVSYFIQSCEVFDAVT